MTKEKARKLLESHFNKQVNMSGMYFDPDVTFPIIDEVVFTETTDKGIEQWSFKGLIKIAYDL